MSSAATTTSVGTRISRMRARRSKARMASMRLSMISTGAAAAAVARCCSASAASLALTHHGGASTSAGPARVVHHDAEVAGKIGHLTRPEGAHTVQAGHQHQRRPPPVLLVVKLGVADGDRWHRSGPRVVHAHGALDVDDVVPALERRRRRLAGAAPAADGGEEVLEPGRRDDPHHDEVLGAVVPDLLLHVVAEEAGGAGHKLMADAVDDQVATAAEADQHLHLGGMRVLAHVPTGGDR